MLSPVLRAKREHLAPIGAWELFCSRTFYKHFAATRLFPTDSFTGYLHFGAAAGFAAGVSASEYSWFRFEIYMAPFAGTGVE